MSIDKTASVTDLNNNADLTVTGTYYTLNTNETVGDDDEVYLPTESINETSILNLLNEGESVFSLTNSLSGYPYFTWITSPPFGTFGTTHDLTVININQRDLSSSVLFSLTLGEEDEEEGMMMMPQNPWLIFFAGAISICAMILPGISGSLILLLLGL